jgi:predicted permease
MTIDAFRHDLRQAARSFVREPGYSLIAVLILAIGIGANTAVFSVVNPLLLRPLPFRDADRLVWIANTGSSGLSGQTFRVVGLEELARHNRSFEGLTAYFAFFGYGSYTLAGRGEAERLAGVNVAPKFLELLGVTPQLGRGFSGDEWKQNGPKAAMLTHGLWQRRFAGDPAIVGQAVVINDAPYLITGVLPREFDFASTFTPGTRVDLLLPAKFDEMREWGNVFSIIGRLKPGVSLDEARAEFATLVPQIVQERYRNWPFGATLTDLKSHISGPMRRALIVLWAAVALVLLIVCANLSNLLLARTAARSKEFAVRMALGASRWRVAQQLVVEGLVLAVIGAGLGVPLAYALTRMLRGWGSLAVPLLHQVQVDGTALLFTAVVAIVSGIAFGAIPAMRVAARPPQEALKAQGRGSTDGRHHARVRSSLVVAEVALATVLLVGAGLLLRSFVEILDVDLGFRAPQAFAVRVDVRNEVNIDDGNARRKQATRLGAAVRRVAELHGVEAVGLTDALPLDRDRSWGVSVPGQVYPDGQNPTAFIYVTGPGYMRAMGIPLRDGRDFTEHDDPSRAPVVIINETLAKLLYPSQPALGQVAALNGRSHTIVGVVAAVRQGSLDEAPARQMYLPFSSGQAVSSDLIVRSSRPVASLLPELRAALAELDSSLLVTEVRPIADLVDRAVSPRRFLLSLIGGFSAIGLLLASLGIYGVISYGVTQRAQEIGVRMALGATSRDVRRQVMGETLKLVAAGLGVGLIAALALARLIDALLFGTSPSDPTTFVAAALVLVTVAALAGYVPALRASRVDPMTALRAE